MFKNISITAEENTAYELTTGAQSYNNVKILPNLAKHLSLNNPNIVYILQLIQDGQVVFQNTYLGENCQGGN